MSRQPWWQKKRILIGAITISVTALIMLIRFLGWFQGFELAIYDRFWSNKAIAEWDERIVMIGFNDDDERIYGHYPSDKRLTEVLQKVQKGYPTTVGLFFSRSSAPYNSEDREALEKQMKSMPNLVRAIPESLYPPEPDNIRRKIELYRNPTREETEIDSSKRRKIYWEIAYQYLIKQGVIINELESSYSPLTIDYPHQKKIQILPLTPLKDGGYASDVQDLLNFQVLISWGKEPTEQLPYIPFSKFLDEDTPIQDFRDKIVIIGGRVQSHRNFSPVPVFQQKEIHENRYDLEIAGIIISNLLNQAENPFVQVWSDEQEYLYLFFCMIISGIFLWFISRDFKLNNRGLKLDEQKLKLNYSWLKFIIKITILWFVLIGVTGFISFSTFPYWWVPSGFIWVGLSGNIILNTLSILAIQVAKEQDNALAQKEQRIQYQKELNRQKKQEITRLKATLIAQERLAFVGRISPFLPHKILNQYDKFNASISDTEFELNSIQNLTSNLLLIVENLSDSEISPEELEDYLELLNLIEEAKNNLLKQRSILKETSRLLDRFLPMLRNDLPKNYVKPKEFSLNDLLTECGRIVHFDFKTFQRDFQVNLIIQLDPTIPNFYGISSELQFTLVNIIENAYDAVFEKSQQNREENDYQPVVKISSFLIGSDIRIIVADNGTGIPSQLRSRIFDPFYTTKKKFQQTGVGLTLAKDIIEQHYQGRLFATMEENSTQFIIEVPLFMGGQL